MNYAERRPLWRLMQAADEYGLAPQQFYGRMLRVVADAPGIDMFSTNYLREEAAKAENCVHE